MPETYEGEVLDSEDSPDSAPAQPIDTGVSSDVVTVHATNWNALIGWALFFGLVFYLGGQEKES